MFLDLLRLQAAEQPDRPALLAPGRADITRGELLRQSERLAATLCAHGIRAQDAVAVALPDTPEFVVAFLAGLLAGACAPLNPRLRENEFEEQLVSLKARAIIAADGSPMRRAAARLDIPAIEVIAEPSAPLPMREPKGAETALLLHTSATTGAPKLVGHTYDNLDAHIANSQVILRITPADRMLGMLPMFHLHGLISFLTQLVYGGSVVITSGFDAGEFIGWLERYRPTWYTAAPALHRAILPLARANRPVVERSGLRLIRSIGAPLTPELIAATQEALGVPVLEGYGLTETGLASSNPPPPGKRKPGSVGLGTGTEIRIDGPPGGEGEILLRGPGIATGQAGGDGWFRTGDLGRLDEDGYLYVTGRIKEIINRGGEKVRPQEVDEALVAHPAVAEAAAFGIPHPTLGEDVAAAVVLRPGGTASEDELRAFVARRLAEYKTLRWIFVADAIPKSATGKPRRVALAERFRAGSGAQEPPRDALERAVAGIWSEVLGVGAPGVHDDFFALGGNSLLAAAMLARVERECGHTVRPDSAGPLTIESIARVARNGAARTSREPALFCIPDLSENQFIYRHLAEHLDCEVRVLVNPAPADGRGAYRMEELAAALVREIRAMQPEGPYRIAGHCFGGIVAFEAARQFAAEGGEAPLLILMDCPMPGYPRVREHWDLFAKTVGAPWWMLRGKQTAAAVGGMLRGARARLMPGHASGSNEVEQSNLLAARAYRPQPFPGRGLHLMARDTWVTSSPMDPRRGWTEVVSGGLDVRFVSGSHETLLAEANAGEAAAEIRAWLAESAGPARRTLSAHASND
ncbi:MAG TPA: AMP-binding protein [Bryobacteraceae bacterium]